MPYRRCEDVVAAFGRIAGMFPDLQLVIAGAWLDARYECTVRDAIERAGIADRVTAPGHVSVEAMRALYRHARVCAIASEVEACPNIAIEAIASGCPIVSSRSEPFPEILGDAARFYEARNVGALADDMRRVLEDDGLSATLRELARKRADAFSWERCADKTFGALTM